MQIVLLNGPVNDMPNLIAQADEQLGYTMLHRSAQTLFYNVNTGKISSRQSARGFQDNINLARELFGIPSLTLGSQPTEDLPTDTSQVTARIDPVS